MLDHQTPKPSPRVDAIITHCARVFQLRRSDIIGRSRHAEVYAARCAVAYIAQTKTDLALIEVARSLGRDRQTVRTAQRRARDMLIRSGTAGALIERAARTWNRKHETACKPGPVLARCQEAA